MDPAHGLGDHSGWESPGGGDPKWMYYIYIILIYICIYTSIYVMFSFFSKYGNSTHPIYRLIWKNLLIAKWMGLNAEYQQTIWWERQQETNGGMSGISGSH